MSTNKNRPLSEIAYDVIKQRIISGKFPQGSRLIVNRLANELILSTTPINEALAALEREGLVASSQNKGYTVSVLKPSDIEQLYSVREAIEALMVRLAMSKNLAELQAKLEVVIRREKKAIEENDMERFIELDFAFHNIFWEMSGNYFAQRFAKLIEAYEQLLISEAAKAPGRFKTAHSEHEMIVEKVRRGDVKASESAICFHIRNAARALKQRYATKSDLDVF
jgi:DNA-binding GntR family transcriptional regulator